MLGAVWKASKRKLQGLTFLVVVGGLIALSIVIYDKDLTSSVPITLQTPRIGHQLIVPGYVTLRGVVVGEVRSVSTRGNYADMSLAIQPGEAGNIPSNVSAVILPETLFGEKYVQLVVPPHPSQRHIYPNETIGYSHTRVSIETSKVFNDLLPLLDALHPVQLSETLSAFADALQGRGNKLGQNFTLVDQYLRGFNPHLPTFEYDLRQLATVSADYTNAAPYLLGLLRNFSVTSRTFTEKQDIYNQFLRGTQGFANTTTAVLTRNEHNLIALANVSKPDLATLAYYSPEYTCLLQGLTAIHPLVSHTFVPASGSAPELHIVLQVIAPTQKYTYPQNKPKNTLNPGPNCDGLPSAPAPPGYSPPPASSAALGSPASYSTSAGTPNEMNAVAALTAPLLRMASSRVPSYADLLLGPMVRGEAVGYS